MLQESLCADAASFDLPSWLLTACISEAKSCIDLSVTRREESNDKSWNPDNFAILRGILVSDCLVLSICTCYSYMYALVLPQLNLIHAYIISLYAV